MALKGLEKGQYTVWSSYNNTGEMAGIFCSKNANTTVRGRNGMSCRRKGRRGGGKVKGAFLRESKRKHVRLHKRTSSIKRMKPDNK